MTHDDDYGRKMHGVKVQEPPDFVRCVSKKTVVNSVQE